MKARILEQRHPGHVADVLGRYRALAEGGETWRAKAGEFIPPSPAEPCDLYAERINRALYTAHAGSIIGMLVAHLFSEPPRVDGLAESWGPALLANCDRVGSSWSGWWAALLLDAMVGRVAACWINLPARPPGVVPANRGEEEKAGLLDCYLVRIAPEELLDWGTDDTGRWTWVLFRQFIDHRASPDDVRGRVWRWTAIDKTTIRRWEWTPEAGKSAPDGEADLKELDVIAHGFPELPVIPLQLPPTLWAMEKLHDPAVDHLRARNDLSWALYRASAALLVINRVMGSGEPPKTGDGYYLTLDIQEKAEYIEPPGHNYELLKEDMETRLEDLYRVLQQMALAISNDSSRVRSSGESKKQDWNAADLLLSAYADQVRVPMLAVLQLIARLRKADPDKVTLSGLNGWRQLTLDELLKGAAEATDAKGMSITFRREIAKRQAEALLPDAGEGVIKAIRAEIDKADPPPDPAPGGPPKPAPKPPPAGP